MARALQLARRGMYTTSPNPRVGSVLVKNRQIVGQGWHERAGGPHAEIAALTEAQGAARGAECYVTLEPHVHFGRTPPCTRALIDAGVARVVAAMEDPNPLVSGRGMQELADAGIAISSGLLGDEAAELNRGFVMRMQHGRPFVRVKLALSADGFTVMAAGGERWITGDAARADVQRLRAESCAVITGIGTVIADDPRLNVRRDGLGGRQPLRVVLDRGLRFPAGASMLKMRGRTVVITGSADPKRHAELLASGAEIAVLTAVDADFARAVLQYLAEKEQMNEVLVEAGMTLAGTMLSMGLVDELLVYQSRVALGDRGRAPFHPPGTEVEAHAQGLKLIDCRAVGGDWRMTFRRSPAQS